MYKCVWGPSKNITIKRKLCPLAFQSEEKEEDKKTVAVQQLYSGTLCGVYVYRCLYTSYTTHVQLFRDLFG